MLTFQDRFLRRLTMADHIDPTELNGICARLQADYDHDDLDDALHRIEQANIRLRWPSDIDRYLRKTLGPPRPTPDRRNSTTPADTSTVLARTTRGARNHPSSGFQDWKVEIAPGEWVTFTEAFNPDNN